MWIENKRICWIDIDLEKQNVILKILILTLCHLLALGVEKQKKIFLKSYFAHFRICLNHSTIYHLPPRI